MNDDTDEIPNFHFEDIDWNETEWEQTEWEEYVFEKGALHHQNRDDQRFRVFLNMKVQTPERELKTLSANVSDGGVFVTTPYHVEPGTLVEMEFNLPRHPEPLNLRGEVRWTQDEFDIENEKVPGFGAKFIDLVSEDRYKLFRYIDELKRSGADSSAEANED